MDGEFFFRKSRFEDLLDSIALKQYSLLEKRVFASLLSGQGGVGQNTTSAPLNSFAYGQSPLDPSQGVIRINLVKTLITGPYAVGFYDKEYSQITIPERTQAPNFVLHPLGGTTEFNVTHGAKVTSENWGKGSSVVVMEFPRARDLRIYTLNSNLVIEFV